MEQISKQGTYTQNRELSWLRFNDSVLDEAVDERVPLLERLKFVSIFTSNLDEFFMIRVGSLHDQEALGSTAVDKKSGMTASQQLTAIYAAVRPLYAKRERIFRDIDRQLRPYGIYQLSYGELENSERAFLQEYYESNVAPILSPQIIDPHHPFPHLQNKVVHVGAWLRRGEKKVFAVIPLPASLPEVVLLPGSSLRCIRTEEILFRQLPSIFSTYTVDEASAFCVTRNADVNPDDEAFEYDEDFRQKMKKVLGARRRLAPVRLEYDREISDCFLQYLCDRLSITLEQAYQTTAPFKMGYVFDLEGKLPEGRRKALLYQPFHPQLPYGIRRKGSVLEQVRQRDLLLSYPFESMDPFLQLIRESASDPAVLSIKITIYRMAKHAKLVDYLCAAAENGKDVTVLIELRARFDEQHNIDWSERLEDAGCTVIYGFEEFKVHSKLCLITRREQGKIRFITQAGTGNYNEKTATMYTDLSLMTADQAIGRDANEFFKNMSIGNLEGKYHHLLVAPTSLKSSLLAEMDREIAKGPEGRILIKINSITDYGLMKKLKEASCAGVQVRMIVRGICCLLPELPGKTENIHITSIVGRFLEHSRIYCFGQGSQERMYIASADFMTRNTERRVEVACPIYDLSVRRKIHQILDACLKDTLKARQMRSDGSYCRRPPEPPFDSQQFLLEQAIRDAKEEQRQPDMPQESGGFLNWLRRTFRLGQEQ
ncbi:MAG: polyphosphate kinase 1 [Clostridiales bacterium]|jgi:polyphosphate kinase|nr:MAG: polyphosphate kinase 1 [Clostridiales bacterium]